MSAREGGLEESKAERQYPSDYEICLIDNIRKQTFKLTTMGCTASTAAFWPSLPARKAIRSAITLNVYRAPLSITMAIIVR
jgi:hypothetical protein